MKGTLFMDIGKFISHIIVIALGLAAIGSLGKVTLFLAVKAAQTEQHERVSLGTFNRSLTRGK